MMKGIMNNELGIRILKIILLYSLFFIPYSISAQTVDLLWQGNTYVSPFYKGKSLWSRQSQIVFMAIPNGLGNRDSLVYRWIKNGTVLGSLSGPGKNTLTLTDTVLSRAQTIRVEIVAEDDYESSILAQALVRLTPVSPMVAVYENNPIYGFLFQKEVSGNYRLKGEEVTFAAFPLFFTALDRTDPRLGYEWQTVGTQESSSSVTYRAPEGLAGSSQVSLRVSSATKIMQGSSKSFLVQFGNENE